MADKKEEKKAPASPPSLEQLFLILLGLFVLIGLVVIPAVLSAFNIDASTIFNASSAKEFSITFIAKIFTTVTFVSIFLSLLFLILIFYAKFRYTQVMERYDLSRVTLTVPLGNGVAQDGLANVLGVAVHGPQAEGGTERWKDVEQKINSASPSDWRLAILEADIILFDMLEEMGLPGKDLGEKLKSADVSFFNTLDDAWKAHKVRNVIAHEGTAYNLSYNEARRAIDGYRKVFEEFYYI